MKWPRRNQRPARFAGRSPLAHPGILLDVPFHTPWLTKEDAECCNARRDVDGRLPVGFCGPNCLRRQERDRQLNEGTV